MTEHETPPSRPGSKPLPPGDPIAFEVHEGPIGPLDADDLRELIGDARDSIEALWEQVDPRTGKPDAFQAVTLGPQPRTLGMFFQSAVELLDVLDMMAAAVDDAPDRPTGMGTVSGGTAFACPTGNSMDDLAKLCEIMSQAGVEVDESDVVTWTQEQREQAVAWVEREISDDDLLNIPMPNFLPGE